MKKYLVLIGAAILVMALASPSMAQFKSWGHMEIQTIWEKNPDFNQGQGWANGAIANNAPTSDTTWRHIAERYRFYLQYGDPKTVRAVIGFEADSTVWGESRSSGTVTGGRMGGYTADSVQLEVKHAYLDWIIPNSPVQVTAGLQGFAYGGRLFWNNDAMGVKVRTDFAPHSVEFFWGRIADQAYGVPANDAKAMYGVFDVYGVEYNIKQKAWDLNAYFAYQNDLWSGWQATVGDPITGGNIPIVNKFDDHPWWLGVQGGYRPGNWTFFGHFVYVGGKREFKTGNVGDQDYKAYAMEASAKYQIGPGMFVGGEFFYASGNDADSQDEINYMPVQASSEARSIFGNDRTVFFWMNASQMGYYHNRQLDFSGMWYARANFEYSPTPWVRFNLNYLYIGDTSSGQAGTITSKISGPGATKIVNSERGAYQGADRDTVGQEINLITTFNIYPGFQWNVGIAAFLPGDVYEFPNRAIDTAWAFNSKLVYAF